MSGQAKLSGSRPGQSVLNGESDEAGIQKDLPDNETSVAQRTITWVLVTLSLVGILGSLAVVLRGRGN